MTDPVPVQDPADRAAADGFDYDVLVIGSGFGGSVTALRLTEKGYRVAVLEAGRRFADREFAENSWHLRDFLFAPALGCTGIQRIHRLDNALILAGAGVGGGSLVYANTLYKPPRAFFEDPQWRGIADWESELDPYYDQARRMLGVVTYRRMTPADEEMRLVADRMGVAATYHQAPVGVFFGANDEPPGTEVADPYFGGAGPSRRTCTHCGECMTGCRHNAKNTLVKNYLHLAEQAGAQIHPLTTVTDVEPLGGGGYRVTARPTVGFRRRSRKARKTFTAEHVVFCAGAYNTQRLLHTLRVNGRLPALSATLGELTRTNSEALLGATARDDRHDFTEGVAITSSIHPDEHTHIEPVRYGKGSNAMGLLRAPLTDGGGRVPRVIKALGEALRHPTQVPVLLTTRKFAERTVILLVMQSLDNSLTVYPRRTRTGRIKIHSRQGHGEPNPTWIPAANQAARLLADNLGGVSGGTVGDLFGMPLTAHILGGAVMGAGPDRGVVDPYHRVFGYEGLHVVDGSAVPANLGVNPSLTITAMAERAMSFWPNKGEADRRPRVGEAYRRLEPVPPRRPAVPESAPGALRLPIVGVS
ncbi:GMC family oxidoreductase [Actinocrinis puniceicyclus]|uniref:Cholesterol oxidase n=1 Tax=Actinocrinis puniceicyclus TaxID=977794 RepID=A0A8J7WIQ4_9ACTN|nr:GMC family oxidoreductase [Actinocrinis puniceicyclus]MBS2961655.1 GMC family oxidoreductase [Actinocrinis puniceicyclus]